jgi:hypothetical protein
MGLIGPTGTAVSFCGVEMSSASVGGHVASAATTRVVKKKAFSFDFCVKKCDSQSEALCARNEKVEEQRTGDLSIIEELGTIFCRDCSTEDLL